MPVTAKLSKRFYDVLGEDVASELVAAERAQQPRLAELVRWMFGFWVSTLIGIAGLLIALRH